MTALPLGAIEGWGADTVAATVLVDGEIVDDHGAVDVPLPWASLTKLATATAVLVAVAETALDLGTPAGPPGSTVRHLLSHASGLAGPGAESRPCGTRRIYSNRGYEVLADVTAAAVDQPFERWLTERVLEPLGMARTRLVGSPASGMVGPVADLVGLVEELQRPLLLAEPLAAQRRSPYLPALAGLLPGIGFQDPNDWGLGPEIRGHKAPHWTGASNDPATFGHFGAAGGFVWVDPVAGVACASLSSRPFGPWALDAWPALADAVVRSYGTGVRQAVTDPS